ncbi:hypothetical protein UlMin_013697 [Ulmus minor]
MASSRKSAPEKKTKQTTKKSIKANSAKNSKKLSNGGVSNGEVRTPSPSSSDSQHEEENGVEITSTPTSSKKTPKGKQKGKRKIEEEDEVKMNLFPMERIRRIVRSEDPDLRISNDAVFLVNKATEKFLEKFCEEAYASSVKDRKKSIAYKHLSSVVSKQKRYDFLSDFVPEKVKAKDALAERNSVKSEAAW